MELYQKINEELGTNYSSNNNINFLELCKLKKIPENLIDEIIEGKYLNSVDFNTFCANISAFQTLSEEFIERHINILDIPTITSTQKLSEEFIELNEKYIDFSRLSFRQPLSEEFIERHKNVLRLVGICEFQKLSENFIEKNIDIFLPFLTIAFNCQKFSEDFIEKYKNKLNNLDFASKYYELSEDFMRRHIKVLNRSNLAKYQKLSPQMISDFTFNKFLIKNNWIYKDEYYKKKKVIETGLYECYDDYFIAYKAIRRDRYSLYNFQYRYDVGGTYESWCDCSDNENSFGLSVGTQNQAIIYGGVTSIVIRCKVRYEDVGRVVHDSEKIRCFKIEILD